MNPRIFKKLTQKAAIEVERLGVTSSEKFLTVCVDDAPEIGRGYKWESKSYYSYHNYRKSCRIHELKLLSGTVGFGSMEGYEEPEWSDNDALSMLFSFVFEQFTDWDNFHGEGWPDNHCPEILKKSARHLLSYSKSLPSAA